MDLVQLVKMVVMHFLMQLELVLQPTMQGGNGGNENSQYNNTTNPSGIVE